VKGWSRLDRRLVEAGFGSRKEVGRLVKQGRVCVDGLIVSAPEEKISQDALLSVDGEPVAAVPLAIVYHKPVGVLVTMDDPWGRATVASVIGSVLASALHPVGRLDLDSSGVLLFSSDGHLTQRLLHPKRAVPKEYVATVQGPIPPDLGSRLASGVETEEGIHAAELVSVIGAEIRLIVTEGKHRMVRRMLANLGLPVIGLVRLRFGPVRLGELPVGETRALDDVELAWLSALMGVAWHSP
jgi:23S rRNA pseudouridine2605 synthase